MTSGNKIIFDWDRIQRRPDGKILLLYRHERMWDEGLIKPGMRVLDIGGWGMLATRLLEEGCRATIIDTFGEDQYYPDRVRSLPHIEMDIFSCKMLNFQADLVTCFEMLEHSEDPLKALEIMRGYLSPNGWIAGTVPVPGFCHKEDEDVHFINKEDLETLLILAGFQNIFIEPTPSINKTDPECPSIYFRAQRKER